jgi:hypothetical protein
MDGHSKFAFLHFYFEPAENMSQELRYVGHRSDKHRRMHNMSSSGVVQRLGCVNMTFDSFERAPATSIVVTSGPNGHAGISKIHS